MKGFIKELVLTLVLAGVIYLLLQTVIQSTIVNNVSMQPTLIAEQRLIVVKTAYTFSDPQRGDIVIVRPPIAPDEEWVKRLIGLPGDTVKVSGGVVNVNGVTLDEPYLNEQPNYTFGPYTVPEGHYFILGDNRNHSYDSHYNWTVTRDQIVGRAWLRIWPFDKFGGVGNYPLNAQVEAPGHSSQAVLFNSLSR